MSKPEQKKEDEGYAERKAKQSIAIVMAWGTDEQIERMQAGVLPAREVFDLLARDVWAPLTAALPVEPVQPQLHLTVSGLEDVTPADWVRHHADCSPKYSKRKDPLSLTHSPKRTLSAEEWVLVKAIKPHLPEGATTTISYVAATTQCRSCDAVTTVTVVRILVQVGEFVFEGFVPIGTKGGETRYRNGAVTEDY